MPHKTLEIQRDPGSPLDSLQKLALKRPKNPFLFAQYLCVIHVLTGCLPVCLDSGEMWGSCRVKKVVLTNDPDPSCSFPIGLAISIVQISMTQNKSIPHYPYG